MTATPPFWTNWRGGWWPTPPPCSALPWIASCGTSSGTTRPMSMPWGHRQPTPKATPSGLLAPTHLPKRPPSTGPSCGTLSSSCRRRRSPPGSVHSPPTWSRPCPSAVRLPHPCKPSSPVPLPSSLAPIPSPSVPPPRPLPPSWRAKPHGSGIRSPRSLAKVSPVAGGPSAWSGRSSKHWRAQPTRQARPHGWGSASVPR